MEMLVTLALVAMITVPLVRIMDTSRRQQQRIDWRMSKLTAMHNTLDWMVEDIISAADMGRKVTVEQGYFGSHDICTVKITPAGDIRRQVPKDEIEWVTVPRYEQEDLLLFRRQKNESDTQSAEYVPLCEDIYSLVVDMMEPNAAPLEDPNAPVPLVEITARMYGGQERDPERLITVRRTFARDRFH